MKARLARISHQPSTAAAQWHALTGVRSVGMLDVVSATPARPSVANASHAAPLNHLATNAGEKSGLAFDIGFDQGNIRRAAGQPLHMLILSDFSGAGSHADTTNGRPLRDLGIRRIDIDNFDRVLAAIAPSTTIDLNGVHEVLAFASLDDFDADAILRRSKLLQAATKAATPAEVANQTAPGDDDEDRSNMLERLLGKAPDASHSLGEALIERIVTPYLDAPTPGTPTTTTDLTTQTSLRAVLHAPAFQTLEADWRALHWLISQIESEEDAKCFLLDTPKQALASLFENDVHPLREKLMDAGALAEDGSGLSVMLGSYYVDASDADYQLLDQAGAVAGSLGSTFLTAASAALMGHVDYAGAAASDWEPDEAAAERWRAFRRSASAKSIGLALPRILLRLPYGKRGEALDAFDFEEMDATPRHQDYLWGNPVYALAISLLSKDDAKTIDDMPMHVYIEDDEKHIKPCAELWISEASVHQLMQLGFTPVASIRNQNAIRMFSPRVVAS